MTDTVTIEEETTRLLLIVGGIKGGVGKSVVHRALIDFVSTTYGDVVVPIESDSAIDAVRHYYPDREAVQFSLSQTDRDAADRLLDLGTDKGKCPILAVNMPGSEWGAYQLWLNDLGFSGDGGESIEGCNVLQPFVSDGTPESTAMIKKSIVALKDRPKHILIKNTGRTTSSGAWRDWDNDGELQALIKKWKIPVFEFPSLTGNAMDEIESAKIPFSHFSKPKDSEEFGKIRAVLNPGGQQRVVQFRRRYLQMFEDIFAWIEKQKMILPQRITPKKTSSRSAAPKKTTPVKA